MSRASVILGGVAAFVVGFSLFEIALLVSVPLAFSTFSTVVALVAFVGTLRLVYDLRCAMRLEVLGRDARNEIVAGLTTLDFERTSTAVANWDAKFVREIDAQIEHPFSMLRFWKVPPRVGKDWE